MICTEDNTLAAVNVDLFAFWPLFRFCLLCLQNYVRDSVFLITCPTCRKDCEIPAEGVRGLPTNIAVQAFLESLKQQATTTAAAATARTSPIEADGISVRKSGRCSRCAVNGSSKSPCPHCNQVSVTLISGLHLVAGRLIKEQLHEQPGERDENGWHRNGSLLDVVTVDRIASVSVHYPCLLFAVVLLAAPCNSARRWMLAKEPLKLARRFNEI